MWTQEIKTPDEIMFASDLEGWNREARGDLNEQPRSGVSTAGVVVALGGLCRWLLSSKGCRWLSARFVNEHAWSDVQR